VILVLTTIVSTSFATTFVATLTAIFLTIITTALAATFIPDRVSHQIHGFDGSDGIVTRDN
jgi:hypothetical protein